MTRELRIERIVDADPPTVWAWWTSIDGLARWWWTHLPGVTYDIDLQVGGEYRITCRSAGIGVHGRYLSLDPPRRFTASWIWVDDGVDGEAEHLDVAFAARGGGTAITIAHSGSWSSDAPVLAYDQGWSDTLAGLTRLAGASQR